MGEFFGFQEVIGDVEVKPGVWAALGCDVPLEDLGEEPTGYGGVMFAGGVEDEAGWTVVRREQALGYVPCSRCSEVGVSDDLVPDSRSLVVTCHTGGTDGVSAVLVLGGQPSRLTPELLLIVSCGQTGVEIDENRLRLSSARGALGAIHPSPANPHFTLTWEETLWDHDRSELMSFFCDTSSAHASVSGYEASGQTNPPYGSEQIDSNVGPIWVLEPTVFGTGPSCEALWAAWEADAYEAGPPLRPRASEDRAESPLATALGIPAPRGERDWYFACFD